LFLGFKIKIKFSHKEQKEKKLRRNFQETHRLDASALNLGNEWNEGWLNCVFNTIWQAYDKLMLAYKSEGKDIKKETENSISSDLVRYANHIKYSVLKGYSTAHVQKLEFHNQPPDKKKSNDIGVFFGIKNNKPSFIFEAKKITLRLTKSGIKDYLEDLNSYLTEYYISHLSESALIAYLHIGTVNKMFELIEKSLNRKLKNFSANRPHKTSEHTKTSSTSSQPNFLCHHLIFEML
jgi:hypothetical protein